MGTVKLKVPAAGFTFKPITIKPKKVNSSYKPLTQILYAVAYKNENGEWEAHVNTRGLRNYQDVTILPFTEKSFDLKGRNDVFRVNKDEKGYNVRIIRDDLTAEYHPGDNKYLCSICENQVFSGHIVIIDGIKQFDMSVYQGPRKHCPELLNKLNKEKVKEEKEMKK